MTQLMKPTADPLPASAPESVSVPELAAVRRSAVIAGGALIAMSALAVFGSLVAVEGLVTPGDAGRTAEAILGSEGTFRLGVLSLYLVVVLDLVVAWALMRVLSPVDKSLSRLDAWFRVAYSAVFLVAISQLAGIPRLLAPTDGAFTTEQLQSQALLKVETYQDIWMAALVLFAVHLAIAGYLVVRSGFIPRIIGVLLVVAGAGYVFDSAVSVLTDSPPFVASNVTFLGEFLLAVWLLVRGHRIGRIEAQR